MWIILEWVTRTGNTARASNYSPLCVLRSKCPFRAKEAGTSYTAGDFAGRTELL